MDAPALEMMQCAPRNMTLSRPGCARLWLSANGNPENRPKPWEGRSACIVCPVGAANAGRVQSPVAGAVDALRLICPRCERLAQRLIHKRLCISCYNREREVRIGRNAKGGRPHLTDRLGGVAIAVTDCIGATRVRAVEAVSAAEAMIAAARKATGWLAFGRPAAVHHHV